MEMRLKSIITLIGVFGFALALGVSGCRHGSSQAPESVDTRSANVAPSDFKADAKAGARAGAKVEGETASADSNKAETNSIVDKGGEGADFAEREEIRRSYKLNSKADVIV